MSEYEKKCELALYYERVSTQHAEQDESMENQRLLVKSFLKRHPEIRLAEPINTYSERISGKSDVRPKYQEMLNRLERGDIRYVLIKDFKRLNRSTELSAQISNHAKEYGYKFILLSTGQIFDPNEEHNRMMYGFESLLNQEVVYRQSEYGRLAHRQKCEAKRLNRNNITFGYAWNFEIEDIIIDEKKAEAIQNLFDLYVFRDYGILELRKYLASIGYQYSANTVRKWLAETAFIGVFHLNKKGSELGVGAGKKTKRYINPKDEWVPVERPDLAIVDKGIFELAQMITKSRRNHFDSTKKSERNNNISKAGSMSVYKQDRFRGTHLFASKIFCNECGYPFVYGYADRKHTVGIYRDSFKTRTRNPLDECSNIEYRRIYEEDLIEIAVATINGMVQKNQECFGILMSTLEQVIREDSTRQDMIRDRQKEIMRLSKEADNLFNKFTHATGTLLADLNQKYNDTRAKIVEVEAEVKSIQSQVLDESSIQEQLRNISGIVDRWKMVDHDSLDRKIVDTFFEKMVVHKDGVIQITLITNRIIEVQLPDNTKRRSRKGFSSSDEKHKYVVANYTHQVYKFLELLSSKKDEQKIILFSFWHTELVGNRRSGKKKNFKVEVEIAVDKQEKD